MHCDCCDKEITTAWKDLRGRIYCRFCFSVHGNSRQLYRKVETDVSIVKKARKAIRKIL